MVLLELTILIGGFVLIVMVRWFVKSVDADLSVTFVEKYGKPISSMKGKVAWIVGCASGIGEALAYNLAENGVKLILTDIKEKELQKVKENCLARGCLPETDVLTLLFDITDGQSYQPNLEKAVLQFGQVDIVFCNAGCSQRADFVDISTEVDKALFNVNVFGHVAFARILLRQFLKQGNGHFVVTSSMLGKTAFPRASTYVATKHALIGYFETIRMEYSSFNINVTICCPAHVFSNLYNKCYTEESGKFFTGGMKDTDKRMTAERCAQLMAIATANKLEEVWPCVQPALTGFYISQYAPTLFKRVIAKKFFNVESADAIRDGRS